MAWEYYMGSLRWVHVIAGITWIGLLYYFNFVQTTSFPKMEGGSRRDAFVNLVPTALWWFRWSALASHSLAGTAWIISRTVSSLETVTAWEAGTSYVETASIQVHYMIGAGLGTIMFLNVWLIIWPNQKKIIAANSLNPENPDAPGPDPSPGLPRRSCIPDQHAPIHTHALLHDRLGSPRSSLELA